MALEVGEAPGRKGFPQWGKRDDEAVLTGQMEKQSIPGKEKAETQRSKF